MDVPARPFLDSFLFQVSFGAGYTYLDRCGQTMVDIERALPDWLPSGANPMSGVMANEVLRTNLVMNWERFEIQVVRFQENLEPICRDAQKIWEIVRENLNLSEFVRVACRFHWLRAKPSLQLAEQLVPNARLGLTIPEEWPAAGFVAGARQLVVVMKRDAIEYRVSLQAVVRNQGLSPTIVTTLDPRFLAKGRKKAQEQAIKNRQSYNADPMYAVDLDVDCVAFSPTKILPAAFIAEQYAVVRDHFLPLLAGL